MEGSWQIVKWVWLVVFCIYLVVQVLAFRRLKGNQKKRSAAVATAMTILMGISDAIRSIFFFENRLADRVGMASLGLAAIIATIVLVAMFGESPVVASETQDDERKIQSLNLG